MGYKVYSDSYLMSMTKAEIIAELRVAEHNFFATEEALDNSAKAGMEIAEKYDKAKELLKAVVEDIKHRDYCHGCVHENAEGKEQYLNCEFHNCYKWRYADEAERLLGDESNGI